MSESLLQSSTQGLVCCCYGLSRLIVSHTFVVRDDRHLEDEERIGHISFRPDYLVDGYVNRVSSRTWRANSFVIRAKWYSYLHCQLVDIHPSHST